MEIKFQSKINVAQIVGKIESSFSMSSGWFNSLGVDMPSFEYLYNLGEDEKSHCDRSKG